MKNIAFLILASVLMLTACAPAATASPSATPTVFVTPTLPHPTKRPATATETPTQTPAPTETPPTAVEYQSSADGTVLWTKEGMANGELKVRDDKSKELRNDTLKALWAVNNSLVNPAYEKDTPQNIIDDRKAFLAKYPNAGALIKYADSGQPVDFIYIPSNSKTLSGRYWQSCMVQKVTNIDLSTVTVGFEILPEGQLKSNDSLSYENLKALADSPYVEFEGTAGEYLVEPITLNDGRTVLSWKFKREASIADINESPFGHLPIYQEQLAEQKLEAVSQLVHSALDMTADLLPQYAAVNPAFDPPEVMILFDKLLWREGSSTRASRVAKYRADYYKRASSPSNSYFELP